MHTKTDRRCVISDRVTNLIIIIIFKYCSWDNQLKHAAVTAETAALPAQRLLTYKIPVF